MSTLWKESRKQELAQREENTENGLANTAMHQPKGQKDKSKSSCIAVIEMKCRAMLVILSFARLEEAVPAVAYLTVCALHSQPFHQEATLTWPVLKHASGYRSPGTRNHRLYKGFPTETCHLPKQGHILSVERYLSILKPSLKRNSTVFS